jgi:hypothetical protein
MHLVERYGWSVHGYHYWFPKAGHIRVWVLVHIPFLVVGAAVAVTLVVASATSDQEEVEPDYAMLNWAFKCRAFPATGFCSQN